MRRLLIFVNCIVLILVCSPKEVYSQKSNSVVSFDVDFKGAMHVFLIDMHLPPSATDTLEIRMPAWTPGYYQLLNFADRVESIRAGANSTDSFHVFKSGKNAWKIGGVRGKPVTVSYQVKAARSFVATPFVDSAHAYIAPTGVFMYVPGKLTLSAKVILKLPSGWKVATGLEPVAETNNQFTAKDFDILFDSPILMGALEELNPFYVRNIPHYFKSYMAGNFDGDSLMDGLMKIVSESVALIGDIPYKHYTFIGIGSGPGGIEHLNSTTFGFNGSSLKSPDSKRRIYTFLAHEYFHHFNVKRIRPVELGPFDYDRENKTTMLWVSEGINVYYDQLLVCRAGLMSLEELLNAYRDRLLGYENKPGRLFQSATDASYNTWSDGPFGRTDDEFNKTVSVYDKGAILGLLLDFNIRHLSSNKKSLDDVMRKLYTDFYVGKKRGFTPDEFRKVCETIAGASLSEIFEYAATVKPINYKKYFAYGGLDIDTLPVKAPGAWLGITTRLQHDSLVVANVDYLSPAWNAGIRRRMVIESVNNESDPKLRFTPMISDKTPGEKYKFNVSYQGNSSSIEVTTGEKIEPEFRISPLKNPDELQKRILEDWVRSRIKNQP